MNKVYLVRQENIQALLNDEEMNDGSITIIIVNSLEFIDDGTFRIPNDFEIYNTDVFYFDGSWDGYYNRIFTNQEYTYYGYDGEWTKWVKTNFILFIITTIRNYPICCVTP